MAELDPPLPTPVVEGAARAWGLVEAYGWRALVVVAAYLVLWPRVASWWRGRAHGRWQAQLNLEEERRRARELQQARWEQEAAKVYAEDAQKKKDKKHDRDAKRKGYDGKKHKMGRSVPSYGSGPDEGLAGYRPNVRDRYKGRGGGGGG